MEYNRLLVLIAMIVATVMMLKILPMVSTLMAMIMLMTLTMMQIMVTKRVVTLLTAGMKITISQLKGAAKCLHLPVELCQGSSAC